MALFGQPVGYRRCLRTSHGAGSLAVYLSVSLDEDDGLLLTGGTFLPFGSALVDHFFLYLLSK